MKKNGYVRLMTNMGPLNLELYCQQAPKTCDNFLRHCKSGYYNDTIFHRSIKSFMVSRALVMEAMATNVSADPRW